MTAPEATKEEKEAEKKKNKEAVEATEQQSTTPALSPPPERGNGPAIKEQGLPAEAGTSPAPQATTKEVRPSPATMKGGEQALPGQKAAVQTTPTATATTHAAAPTNAQKESLEKAAPSTGGFFGRLMRGGRQADAPGNQMQQLHAVRSYYLSPENKLDAAMEKEFQGRMAQGGAQGDGKLALRATVNSAFLKLRYPQLFNGSPAMRDALMKRHATMRWNIRTRMDEAAFFDRVKADYELDNLLITAADFAVAKGVDLRQAKDGALQKLMNHPGWNAKLLTEYEGRFDAAAAHAQELARSGGNGAVQRMLPGKSPAHLFAKTPPPEMAVNGNIIVPGGHYLQDHTLATRLLKGYEIVDRNASLPEMMKVAGNEGLYFKSSPPEAPQNGQGTTTAKQEPSWWDSATEFVKSLTRGPGIQPSLNHDSEGYRQLEAHTELQIQRDSHERQMLDDAQALSRERAVLLASTQSRRKQIDKEYAGDERGKLLRELDLEYGKQNLALAKRQSELLWKSAEFMGDGKVSVQTYEQTGKLLDEKSLASTYRGTPQLSGGWRDISTRAAQLSEEPGMQDIAAKMLDAKVGLDGKMAELSPRLKKGGDKAADTDAQNALKAYMGTVHGLEMAVRLKRIQMGSEFKKMKRRWDAWDAENASFDGPQTYDRDAFNELVEEDAGLREGDLEIAAGNLGLTTDQARAKLHDVKRMTDWSDPKTGQVEVVRTLSDGSIVFNPNRLINKGAVEAAIRAAETTPEAKQAALRRLPEVRAQAINYFFTELSKHEGFEEQLDGYGGSQDEALQHFLDDANQSPHWTQIRNRVLGGFMGLLTSGAGTVAGITGHDDAHTVMELFSGKQGAYELKASMVDTNGFTRAVSKVGGAAPSLIPALTVGRFAGWAGKFAGLSPQATQTLAMLVSSITAGGQSFGSVYHEAHEAYVDAGMAEKEARRAALKPAIIGGLITAAMTQAGGANGVEAVFRGAGARELVKRTLWERAKMVGIDMTEEALEEGTDQLLQGIVGSYNHRRDLTHEQILDEAVEAAWIGGLLGGTVSGVQEGSQALWNKDGKLHEAVTRPIEDAPMEGVVMPSSEGEAGGNDPAGSDSTGPDGDIWKPSIGGGGPYEVEEEEGAAKKMRVSFSRANAPRGEEQKNDIHVLSDTFEMLRTDETSRRGAAVPDKDLNVILQTMASRAETPETVRVEPNPPMRPETERSYVVTINEGGEVVVNVEKNGTVWVDTQGVRGGAAPRKAQGGDLVYQGGLNYAHSHGLVFVPDPREVKPIAQRRRISHMISSALRHGTTRHFNPYHADDINNRELPPRSEWREEKTEADFKHNLNLLLRAELKYVEQQMKDRGKSLADLRYDPNTDTVWQKQGGTDGGSSDWRQLSENDYAALVTGLDPGRSGVGETTLARALLAKFRLERQESGVRSEQYFRSQTPDGGANVASTPGSEVFRLLRPAAAPRQLFYSRGEATGSERVQRTGVTRAETTAAEARLKSTAQGRAIYGNVLIVDNRAALDGMQGRPGQQRYHAEDWDIMQDAEGFHDPRDGTVVIFRDNVRVLEGETAAQAMAGVVVHERVGHHGFDALRASDSKFAEEWKKLAAAIPADQMKELEARYTHLKGNRDALALEWFAHQVGNMEGRAQLEPGSITQRMWQAMRDWVVRYYNPLGDASKGMTQDVIDAHVRGLIRATQRSMTKRAERDAASEGESNIVTSSPSAIQNQNPTGSASNDSSSRLQSQGAPGNSEPGNSRARWIRGKYRPPQHVGKHYVRDISSLLNALGVSDIKSHVFTTSEVSRMLGLLVKSNPVNVSAVVSEVDQNATFTRGQLLDIAQSFVSLLPDRVTDLLKAQPVSIRFDRSLGPTEFGGYNANVITFNPHMVTTVSSMYRTMYHELMHWVHEHGPAEYRHTIRTLMHTRTNGFTEPMESLHQFGSVPYGPEVKGMRDDFADQFGDEYPGRIYPKELRDNGPQGCEIPSVHLEKLAYHPKSFANYLNHRSLQTGKYAWREAFFEALTIFF